MISPERVAQVFVEIADTLVDDFDLIEFLQKVTARSSELSDTRDAGLLLADRSGQLQLLAATDERAERIEVFQVQTLEGPCQDCFAQGTAIINLDLTEATDRWPRFAPKAVSLGYRSVHAFPLRLRGEVFGALNLFGDAPGQLSESEAAVIQSLADIATIGLLQERTIKRGELLTE